MRCTRLKSQVLSRGDPRSLGKNLCSQFDGDVGARRLLKINSSVIALALALCWVTPAISAEFLDPLPLQEIRVGERYTLGIRPSRAPARSAVNTKLDLYAAELSVGASFRRIGDELWEFAWTPSVRDKGVHAVRILVTERGQPSVVIETEELTFIVGDGPVQVSDPDPDPVIVEASALSVPPDSVNFEAANDELKSQGPQPERNDLVSEPEWSLAPLASHIVTPHQWVRFEVALDASSEAVKDYVAVQIDRLPNGASFDPLPNGNRQFQWRPGTSDQGEHTFWVTAVNTENPSQSESVNLRIIVQE